jgi:hypothetical protein
MSCRGEIVGESGQGKTCPELLPMRHGRFNRDFGSIGAGECCRWRPDRRARMAQMI